MVEIVKKEYDNETFYGYYDSSTNLFVCHRDEKDGPSLISSNGTTYWFLNGGLHREHGPAVIYPDGKTKWFIDDMEITDEVKEWLTDRDIFDYTDMTEEDKLALSFYMRSLV